MPEQRRDSSPAGRAVRVIIWTTFLLVLLVRFGLFREEREPEFPVPVGWERQEQRFRGPAAWIHPPEAEVPKDLPRLAIEIALEDVEILRGYYWSGGRGQRVQERPSVKATVREDGQVYTNVALHLKGAAGSFRPFDNKPALTLNFAKHAPGQRFRGYSKLSLNNSVQDPSYLCEVISREIFDAAGVPVPQAAFATVLINGRDLGLYVMVEGYNKDFLRRYFNNVSGNLYDGGFVQDIHANLHVNSGDRPEDRSELTRLLATASLPAPLRWERLTEVLDVDRFVTLIALEVMLCHWDGYTLNRNNYRVFHDLESDRMIFMPHGMDQMFDFPPGRFPANGTIYPAARGQVARALLATREGDRLYFERMAELQSRVFQEEAILARVQELAQRIRPTIAAYSPAAAERHDAVVASLCDRISRRVRSVAEQLQTPREPLLFDASGTAQLATWNERLVTQGPGLRMDTVEQDGRTFLRIAAVNRGGTSSWRTRVHLETGRYRFEGRARSTTSASGARVALRISGGRPTPQPLAGTDWVWLSYPFTVETMLSEVVLVCEFSGNRGEALFDVESLRLVRE